MVDTPAALSRCAGAGSGVLCRRGGADLSVGGYAGGAVSGFQRAEEVSGFAGLDKVEGWAEGGLGGVCGDEEAGGGWCRVSRGAMLVCFVLFVLVGVIEMLAGLASVWF